MFYVLSLNLLFPYCSRTSGFKSSMNEVHLRIYHAVEATSYLSDAPKVPYRGQVSSYFLNNPTFLVLASHSRDRIRLGVKKGKEPPANRRLFVNNFLNCYPTSGFSASAMAGASSGSGSVSSTSGFKRTLR